MSDPNIFRSGLTGKNGSGSLALVMADVLLPMRTKRAARDGVRDEKLSG